MKKLVTLSFSVLLLALSVFVVNAATFQGPPTGCTNPQDPNCNLDGVIWNRATTAPQAQDASFYIGGNTRTGGNARVGNGLTVDSGDAVISLGNTKISNGNLLLTSTKAIHVDQTGSRSYIGIGNYGGGPASDVEVTVFGTLKVDTEGGETYTPQIMTPWLCLNGDCRNVWPSGGGGGGTVTSVGSGNGLTGGPITTSGNLNVGAGTGISVAADTVGLDTTYTDGRYVNVPGDTMTGALYGTQFIANSSVSSPVYYSGTYGVNPYSRIFYDEILLADSNGRLDIASNSFKQVAQTWSGNFPWTLDMRSLSNYNTMIGQVVFGNADIAGYFMRYIGAVSGNVGIVDTQGGITWGINSNVPSTNAYAGRFNGGSGVITLGGPLYTLDTAGTARFTGQVCIGGTCLSNWPSAGGGGDLTDVLATPNGGIIVDSSSGPQPSVGLIRTCLNGQILKWNGSAWTCAADIDTNSGGDITGVTAGNGLNGGGTSGAVTLGLMFCSLNGQILKWNGVAWVCASDNGTINRITANSPLTGGGTSGDVTLGFMLCSLNGQILKWNGVAWVCSTDANSGGDITAVYAGTNMTGGGTTGAVTLNVTDNWVNTTGDTMTGNLGFGSVARQMINLYSTTYALGVQSNTAYSRTVKNFAWYKGGVHSNLELEPGWGGTQLMQLNETALIVQGNGIFGGSLGVAGSADVAGKAHLSNADDAGPTTYGALTIGPKSGGHLRFDGNEIMARNGSSAATLHINADGGTVAMGYWTAVTVQVNGVTVHGSDRKLKKDISKLSYGLKEIMELSPVDYKWKNGIDEKKHLGFIAQDVQQIMPELIFVDSEKNILNLDYTGIIPVVVNATQEQQEMITDLQSQNDELRTQNKDLENRLERLESILRYVK